MKNSMQYASTYRGNNMQAILILAVLLILVVLGQNALLIWFAMGVSVVLIVRHYVAVYETNKKKESEVK